MRCDLNQKQILLIAPNFFGYEQEIKKELEAGGAKVDLLLDRPFKSPFVKALTTINRQLVMGAAKKYYQKQLTEFGRSHYDIVFVINGQTLSPDILRQWKQAYPDAQYVLYIWDSIKNRASIQKNFEFFDYCFSFDKQDADTFGLRFLPLFFTKGFEQALPQENPAYDLSFVGTAHSIRYAVISRLAKKLPKNIQLYQYLYLQAKWVYWYYKLTKPAFRTSNIREFSFVPLAKDHVHQVFSQSKVILDIEHPAQTGLTIRSLEAFGAKKKLITTNKSIVDYDFYTPENIFVLDKNSQDIPETFFHEPYKEPDPAIYKKYSIAGWLEQILDRKG